MHSALVMVSLFLTGVSPISVWSAAHPSETVIAFESIYLSNTNHNLILLKTEKGQAHLINESGTEVGFSMFTEDRMARLKTKGTFSNALISQLDKIGDRPVVVAIWARAALKQYTPRSKIDPDTTEIDLAAENRAREALRAHATGARAQLETLLRSMRAETIATSELAPVVFARLSRAQLAQLKYSEAVDWIEFADYKATLNASSATATARINTFHDDGYFGNASTAIALVEPGRILNHPSDPLRWLNPHLSPTEAGLSLQPSCNDTTLLVTGETYQDSADRHVTAVASVAASSWSIFENGASKARLISATGCRAELYNLVVAAEWISGTARVLNNSWGTPFNENSSLFVDDVLVDYRIRHLGTTEVKACGNDARYKGVDLATRLADCKSYNNIKVGGINNRDNSDWSDDTPYLDGQWRNLANGRELPEVVASAQNVYMANTTAWGTTGDGTSFAAPQVSAIAALAMQVRPALRSNPETLKAVILAGAIHNITDGRAPEFDPTSMQPYTKDSRDGVGAVSAKAVRHILYKAYGSNQLMRCSPAQFAPSCQGARGFFTSGYASLPDGEGYTPTAYVYTPKHRVMRVALTWNAEPFCSSCDHSDVITWGETEQYEILSDLDLYVTDATGAIVARSVSLSNNYEMVDFDTSRHKAPFTIRIRYGRRFPILSNQGQIFWHDERNEDFGLAVYDYDLDSQARPVE